MEEKSLKILAVQMSSVLADKHANFKKVEEIIDKNFINGVDIIVLPEVWTVGWKPSVFRESAEDVNTGETFEFLSKIAKKYKTNIIGGSFITKKDKREMEKGKRSALVQSSDFDYFNTCPVIDKSGELVASYNKMHLFSYYGCMEGQYVENGKNPVMIEFCSNSKEIASVGNIEQSQGLKSRNDVIKIGLSICYDIRFPELYRAYAQAGADMLINMAAWPMSRAGHWESLTKARAIENQCFMLALTQSGLIENEEFNLGHSRVIDYSGEVVSEIDKGEGAMFAELKFDEMYRFRKKCTVLLDICDAYDVK